MATGAHEEERYERIYCIVDGIRVRSCVCVRVCERVSVWMFPYIDLDIAIAAAKYHNISYFNTRWKYVLGCCLLCSESYTRALTHTQTRWHDTHSKPEIIIHLHVRHVVSLGRRSMSRRVCVCLHRSARLFEWVFCCCHCCATFGYIKWTAKPTHYEIKLQQQTARKKVTEQN